MNEGRTVLTTFCDDIRQEVGYKYSMIGCYPGGELIIDRLPVTLPKLFAAVQIITPLSKLFESLTIRAFINDKIILEDILPIDKLPNESEINRVKGPDDSVFTMLLHFAFVPLFVESESRLRIEAETEEGVIKSSSILIRARKESDLPLNQ